jgi:hypothetical protein
MPSEMVNSLHVSPVLYVAAMEVHSYVMCSKRFQTWNLAALVLQNWAMT